MDFLQKRKEQLKVHSLGDLIRQGKVNNSKTASLVNGPTVFDCLVNKWTRTDLMALIGDSGSGKSEVVLYIFKEILKNNPNSCAVFCSLEMTTQKIAFRWLEMTKDCPELADRLYIISRYTEEGKPKEVNVGWVQLEMNNIKNIAGDVIAFAVDHLHILGENTADNLNSIAFAFKELSVEMNAFGILLAQVSKSKGQGAEVPLDADAVYGCSQLKWCADYILQVHRPIMRLENDAGISVLGWGFCKVREMSQNDKIKRGQNKLLIYDYETRGLRNLKAEEKTIFKNYYDTLIELKQKEEEFKSFHYDLSTEVKAPNGKIVVLPETFSGSRREDEEDL